MKKNVLAAFSLSAAILALTLSSAHAAESSEASVSPEQQAAKAAVSPAETKPVHALEFDIPTANVPAQLLLEPDDVIRLAVFNRPELTLSAPIQKNGTVTLPIVGEFHAAGRSVEELRQDVVKRFRESAGFAAVKLTVGDTLRMSVWKQVELTADLTIRSDGMLTFPLIGDIKAEGMGIAELTEIVRKKLSAYLRDPKVTLLPMNLNRNVVADAQVSILPEKLRDRTVAVLGEVDSPGLVPLRSTTRLVDVLAVARYKEGAELNNVIVIRSYKGEQPLYQALRIADYMDGKAFDQNVYLRSDDIVIVSKSRITKITDFIDKFFTRTRPIFDWWLVAQQARYAREAGEASRELNDLLRGKK